MYKNILGEMVLEIDPRLGRITRKEELDVSEAELFNAIKGYKLDETLEQFALISKKIFDNAYPEEWHRMGRGGIQHPSGVFLTQFALEYLASAMILSGSNNWKNESVKNRDNMLGLFNVYQNGLIQEVSVKSGVANLLIPMYFQQFVSQAEPKDVFTRQWYLFYKIDTRLKDKTFDSLNDVFLKEVGITMLEYTKLCFVIFATILTFPRFNIGKLTGANISGLNDVLDEAKMSIFLNLVSADYDTFRKLDSKINEKLDPRYTKTRFNPLWLKPIIRMAENDFLAPSMTAYMTSTFKGLFWWFDAYFRKQSRGKGDDFRSYFGTLFEEYAGDVIKDIYGENKVSPQIGYGSKQRSGLFFDWIVDTEKKTFLFEIKGYQFPLEVLQKGDPENVRREVTNKIIKTIIQMYKRVRDVEDFDELKHLKGRNLIPIAVFYDIPLISTPMYQESILPALKDLNNIHPGIKDFKYYMLSIEELEDYYYVSDKVDIDVILQEANISSQTGFRAELSKAGSGDPITRKNILDRGFNEYCSEVIGVKDQA